ncbi:MAG: hypothetical protein JW787_17630 [Sedimentisphaerales bacterium]|nr:hypothetical protein [Sedimentisphaerales bacterium]
MKTLSKIIICFIAELFFCIQPLQAQTTPTVAFYSSSSYAIESYKPPIPIKVVLSEANTNTVTVKYSVTGGTATGGGVDYTLNPGTLTFSPGETIKYVPLYTVYDIYGEDDETIIITLSDPTNATLGSYDSHEYTIKNDDDGNRIAFYESSSSGYESENSISLKVGLFADVYSIYITGTVDYSVTGGTATGEGNDYVLDSGTLTISTGEYNYIEITINDDSIVEENETIIVTLSNPTGTSLGTRVTHTYTILNDDDETAPDISEYFPEPNSIQAARNSYIMLEITDSLSGVDANTVKIWVEGTVIYDGASAEPNGTYNSSSGTCRRAGTEKAYTFFFLPSSIFDYEQKVDVLAYAVDKDGNIMNKEPYSFYTVMRSFGANLKVNSDTGSLIQDHPSAATDSSGNIWVVWDQTNSSSDADIYIGKLAKSDISFGTSSVVYSTSGLHTYPVIAIDSDDNLYVAWQGKSSTSDKTRIYVSKSTDGATWSTPAPVTFNDAGNEYNQTSPVIAIDHDTTDTIYIACVDDRSGNQDIWISSSTNGTTWTPTRINTNTSNQTEPAIAINNHVAYIGWTDARNASTDIYGASSNNAWAEEEWIITSSIQSRVALAADPVENVIHQFWVDNAGGNYDIFYRMDDANATGISITDEINQGKNRPSAGVSVIDGSSMVFAAWRDWRNVLSNNDTDIYYTEYGLLGFGTNILINDDMGTSPQSNPAVNVDLLGNPYIVWADQRNGNMDIYYSGATSISETFPRAFVSYGDSVIIQTTEKVQISIPSDSIPDGLTVYDIEIARLLNPPKLPDGGFGKCYDFMPSGLQFSTPVTITISHTAEDCPGYGVYQVYWYNTQTGTWSQDGISNVQHNFGSVHNIEFQTTHFSTFVVAGYASSGGGDSSESDSGGGCAISPYPCSRESIGGFFVPYIVYILILFAMSWTNKRKQKVKNNS